MEETSDMEVERHEMEEALIKRDVFVRKAKQQDWRSRTSLKLLQIDERFGILKGVKRAVDLYSSPGLWTQVLSRTLAMGETISINDKYCLFYSEFELQQKLEAEKKPEYNKKDDVVIVSVDPYGIPSYPGVVQMSGDLAEYSTAELILKRLGGTKADLVVCNRIVDHTGLDCVDVNYQVNHMVLVLHTTCHVLRVGGTLVAAIFKETDNDVLKFQLLSLFRDVDIFKPKCSKISAKEIFAICRQYSPPEGFDPKLMGPYLDFCNKDFSPLEGINRIIIPFILCGDVSAYPLSKENEELFASKFTDPFPQDEPCSSRSKFRLEDMDYYMKKINEAIKSIGLESDPDLSEMEKVKEKNEKAGSSNEGENANDEAACKDEDFDEANVFDNGPLFDLIQKTTKIKKYRPEADESENAAEERGLQLLYEDQYSDPATNRECLQRVSNKSSTCTCDDVFS